MSLPSSEPLPNDINELPPARQRHIRRQPRSASFAERQILLDSLAKTTSPTLNFFMLAILGSLAIGVALYFNEPAILIGAIVILPFHKPVFGLSLLPASHKLGQGLQAVISLLILSALGFGAGSLSGWLQPNPTLYRLDLFRFSTFYWVDLVILVISTLLSAVIILREGVLPRVIGVLLSYTLLIPLAVAGFGLTTGLAQLWPGAMLTALAHLSLALVVGILAFILLGFPPKSTLGWLMAIVPLAITLALISGSFHIAPPQTQVAIQPSPSPTQLAIASPSATHEPVVEHSPTATVTAHIVEPTETQTPMPTNTSTATPTIEPTTYWADVDSAMGAIVRQEPAFDSLVVTYLNNAEQVEILDEYVPQAGTRWFRVLTQTGETGWILGSLVNTQTPTP